MVMVPGWYARHLNGRRYIALVTDEKRAVPFELERNLALHAKDRIGTLPLTVMALSSPPVISNACSQMARSDNNGGPSVSDAV